MGKTSRRWTDGESAYVDQVIRTFVEFGDSISDACKFIEAKRLIDRTAYACRFEWDMNITKTVGFVAPISGSRISEFAPRVQPKPKNLPKVKQDSDKANLALVTGFTLYDRASKNVEAILTEFMEAHFAKDALIEKQDQQIQTLKENLRDTKNDLQKELDRVKSLEKELSRTKEALEEMQSFARIIETARQMFVQEELAYNTPPPLEKERTSFRMDANGNLERM